MKKLSQWRHAGIHLLIQNHVFRRIWLATTISGLGDQLGTAGTLWATLVLTKSATDLGLLFLTSIPAAWVSPFYGALGDRYPRTKLMGFGNGACAVLVAAIGCAILFAKTMHAYVFAVILVLVVMLKVFRPLTQIGYLQVLSESVAKEDWAVANSMFVTSSQFTLFLGPAIAGVLVACSGIVIPMFVDAVSFIICTWFFFFIPSKVYGSIDSVRQIGQRIAEGFSFLRKSPILIANSLVLFLFTFFFGAYSVALPFLADDRSHGAAAYGSFWSLFALGTLAGGVILAAKNWKWPVARAMNNGDCTVGC